MSAESTQLSRATLEAKDRGELQTIASAMGGKPGSRARKAEIVDLILELAGVKPDNGSGNGSGDTDGDGPADGRSVDGRATDRTTGTAGGGRDVSRASGSDGEDASNGSDRGGSAASDVKDSDSKGGESGGAGTDSASKGGESGGGGSDSASKGGESGGEGTDSDSKGGESRGGGTDSASKGGESGGAGTDKGESGSSRDGSDRNRGGDDQSDQGNRRRRRRGRDRDRGGDDQYKGEPVDVEGHLDLRDEGYGFLRVRTYLPSKEDVYVSAKQVRQFGLRRGDHVKGASRPANRNEKNPALMRIDSVNGGDPEKARERPRFEDLTPLFPDEKLRLERADDPMNMTARIIDLIAPIGKGQRGLIVSPPKAGKTTIVKEIVRSIETNNPECKVIVLLVDERPEEVTDMRRWLLNGECVASTFDRPSEEHTQVAELTIERAKRLVETGEDVVIVLDGITRLARAYNLAAPATGRIMSGGVDSGALYPPKKFFGAARNVEEGGSLTILATALVETGSKMDEVIFEEFKGTGNMELRLDRRTAERRVYPAIDVDASSTRHEELLFERRQLQQVWKLRRVLSGLASDGEGGGAAGLELLIDRLKTFPTNDAFLEEVAKGPMGA